MDKNKVESDANIASEKMSSEDEEEVNSSQALLSAHWVFAVHFNLFRCFVIRKVSCFSKSM